MEKNKENIIYSCKDCGNYNKHYIFFKNKFHYIGQGSCIRKRGILLSEDANICPCFIKLNKEMEKKFQEEDLKECLNKIYDLMIEVSYSFCVHDEEKQKK